MEQVLAVRTAEFWDAMGYVYGCSGVDEFSLRRALMLAEPQFIDRGMAEVTPAWKQVIPYITVFHDYSNESDPRVLTYRRGKKGAEARLHGKLSLGFGGHVNPQDAHPDHVATPENSIAAILKRAMHRELSEELSRYDVLTDPEIAAIINHDDSSVASVHLGVLHTCAMMNPADITHLRLETDLVDLESMPLQECLHRRAEFEEWSQFAIQFMLYKTRRFSS